MFWMITEDLIPVTELPSRVGVGKLPKQLRQPSTPTDQEKRLWIEAQPFEFKLLDDDGETYYLGVCGDLNEADGDQAFAPLDWAMADAGCTTMMYRQKGTKARWETL